MGWLLDSALSYVAYAYLVWIGYLAIMHLKLAHDEGMIPKVVMPFAYFTLAIGLILDFGFNMVSSVVFLELPHEFLFTQRCERHIGEGYGWRKIMARFICKTFLDPFALHGHCR